VATGVRIRPPLRLNPIRLTAQQRANRDKIRLLMGVILGIEYPGAIYHGA
jgi:hypothetical protein